MLRQAAFTWGLYVDNRHKRRLSMRRKDNAFFC